MNDRGQKDNGLRKNSKSRARAREIIQGGEGEDSRKGGKVDKYGGGRSGTRFILGLVLSPY